MAAEPLSAGECRNDRRRQLLEQAGVHQVSWSKKNNGEMAAVVPREAYTHKHTYTHTHTGTYTYTHTHTHTYTRTHTHTHTYTHTHTHTQYTHIHNTHIYTNTHTHTHTHTQPQALIHLAATACTHLFFADRIGRS